MKAWLLCQVC